MPKRGMTTNPAQRPCLRGVWTYMQKIARCMCIARHTIITNSVFYLLLLLYKTRFVMMEVRRRVSPACSGRRSTIGFVIKNKEE